MAYITSSASNYFRMFMMVSAGDHITPITGLTPKVLLSKAGSSFGVAVGAVAEVGSGMYSIKLNSSDTAVYGDLAFHCIAANADNTDFVDQIVIFDTTNGQTLGLTALPSANAGATGGLATVDSNNAVKVAQGTGANQINLSSGNVSLTTGQLFIKKNTALNSFMFLMTDSTNHAPKTGLTVTPTVSIDGGAFGATANTVTEVANGWYKINLANTDVNGTIIALRFTATNADDRNILAVTQA